MIGKIFYIYNCLISIFIFFQNLHLFHFIKTVFSLVYKRQYTFFDITSNFYILSGNIILIKV